MKKTVSIPSVSSFSFFWNGPPFFSVERERDFWRMATCLGVREKKKGKITGLQICGLGSHFGFGLFG